MSEEHSPSKSSDVFEINDFTVVTEYECFVAQLENKLNEWGISGRRPSALASIDKELQTKSAIVKFKQQEYEMVLNYHEWEYIPVDSDKDNADKSEEESLIYLTTAAREMISPGFDFNSQETVFTQYGVLEHIMVTPVDSEQECLQDLWLDMLSTFNVALVNTNCEIPMFLCLSGKTDKIYNGVCVNRNVRTIYENFHASNPLHRLEYFSGLVDMFKEKVASPQPSLPAVGVSLQFDYTCCLNTLPSVKSSLESLRLNQEVEKLEFDFKGNSNIVKKLYLGMFWPGMNSNMVHERREFCDLEPGSARDWLAEVEFCNDRPGALFRLMDVFFSNKNLSVAKGCVSSLSRSFKPCESEIAAALLPITGLSTDKTIDFSDDPKDLSSESPLSFLDNKRLLKLIFSTVKEEPKDDFTEFQKKCFKELAKCKAAPSDSLTSRICRALLLCVGSKDDLDRISTTWLQFVERLTSYWDNAEDIPGIPTEMIPDLGSCLLHQKIQMLQFCIDTKRKRQALLDADVLHMVESSSSSSCSDTFYDAEDEDFDHKSDQVPCKPKGRSEALDESLLCRPKIKIYAPLTQDKGPLTDDMIDNQAKLFSAKSSDDRVKDQVDALLSDMQAFKAANPGCVMEDFICWHSPRDWSKDSNGKVTLSERMITPNNLWLETWKVARPIAVSSQHRLFNEAKEAHSVLQYFRTLTLDELIELVRPVIFSTAIEWLVKRAKDAVAPLDDEIYDLAESVCQCTRDSVYTKYSEIHRKINFVEKHLFSFCSILENLEQFVEDEPTVVDRVLFKEFASNLTSLQKKSVKLADAPSGPITQCLLAMVTKEAELKVEASDESSNIRPQIHQCSIPLPEPTRKHYILHWLVPRPGYNSRRMPQRLYVYVSADEFRAYGAFTDDSTFM